jgi:hypothetical protein
MYQHVVQAAQKTFFESNLSIYDGTNDVIVFEKHRKYNKYRKYNNSNNRL